jgi:MFS family permease
MIFGVSTALFVLSQFYRATIAVISPQLMTELALDTRQLSLITSAFFYAFALAQIPIGLSLDRIGARYTMTVLSLVAVAGAAAFAAGHSVETLVAARMLLGIGMACNLIGTFKLLTLWFAPRQFATLTTLVFSIGTLGNIAATTPLVVLVQAIGWRSAFMVFSATNLGLAVAFFWIVRDRPPAPDRAGGTGKVQRFRDVFAGFRKLLGMRDYWIISIGTFCHYGIWAAIQTLWAGPYLIHRMGLSAVAAGNFIFLMNMGFVLGGPLWGVLSDNWLHSRKGVVLVGIAGMAGLLAVMAVLPEGAGWMALTALFFSFGLSRSAGGIMYAHIKERMPIETAGTAMTGINFFTMIGAAVFLQAMGSMMQHLYPETALGAASFRTVYLLCCGCLVVVFFLYLWTRETANAKKR